MLLSRYRLLVGRDPALPGDAPESVLERFHINAPAPEADALGFQQEALLQRQLAAQRNPATRTQYALPGQAIYLLQDSANMPRTAWISRGFRDRAISADAPARYLPDNVANSRDQRRNPRPWRLRLPRWKRQPAVAFGRHQSR